ncbi:MAG: LysM peptidoglycan-binding domain-containing protein [Candidatus Promineifilaceae bacterium]|nr:LysM peptidoglycan-binding domain-containing protein [Candidatus Promineifilaceae bacterium]
MDISTRRLWRTRFFLVPLLLALFFLPAVVQATDDTHTVRRGENLNEIAQRYDVTVRELLSVNTIANPNWIYPGQVLVIPEHNGGENEDDPDESGEEAATAGETYVVRAGDSLFKIARRYEVTLAALRQANNLYHTSLIYPGQQLTIPNAGSAPAAEGAADSGQTPQSSAPPKQIVVDKSDQRAYVYENGQLRWTFIVSTGMPGSETWEGTFQVRSKIPNAYAYLWGLQMPYWLGFYHTGYLENGFHALPIMSNGAILWEGYLGTPVSYGCVILSYADAETLYHWAAIGTEVVVRP